MKVEQISIFLENKSGRLADVTDVLAKADINIRALALADSDIWINPSRAEAVPAICGKGRRAMAMAWGSTSPMAMEYRVIGSISASTLLGQV